MPSDGTTCCSRTHQGLPAPGCPETPPRGGRPGPRQVGASARSPAACEQQCARPGPLRSASDARARGILGAKEKSSPGGSHPAWASCPAEPQPVRRVDLAFLRPPPGAWSRGGRCSPGGLGHWHKFQCAGSWLPPGPGRQPCGPHLVPRRGFRFQPWFPDTWSQRRVPTPIYQPPAGARGDARLGKHGASLGLKEVWQLPWGPPARQGASED